MKKLLITGFEPFGGEQINPSWEVLDMLPDQIGDYTLERLRIPVVFGRAAAQVVAQAERTEPDVILCIGQAGGRDAVTPELVGINLRHGSIPDNAGTQPQDEPVLSGGDCAYFSTLPVRRMVAAMTEQGVGARLSYSAGAYVCNDVLYSLLARFCGTPTRVGFIHVPYCKEQDKQPCMEMSEMARALTIAIEHLDDGAE